MTCHYLHFKDPFLKLGPFKLEEVNYGPFVAIFHDFFHDREMEAFVAFAADGRLRRSLHFNK